MLKKKTLLRARKGEACSKNNNNNNNNNNMYVLRSRERDRQGWRGNNREGGWYLLV